MKAKLYLTVFFLFLTTSTLYLLYKEEQNLILDGFIVSPNKNTFTVRNKVAGYIDKILFPNLSHVNKNDLVMTLSTNDLNNEIEQQQIKQDSFKGQRIIIMSALDELRDNLELLDQRMSSYESLIDQGFITSNHLIDLEIRKNQLTFDIQEKTLQLRKIDDEIFLIKNSVKKNKESLSEFSLDAPISGVINFEDKAAGLYVEKNSVVFSISELNTKVNNFEFYLKPLDLERIELNQQVKLVIDKDTYSSITTYGKIDYVDPTLVDFNNLPHYRIIGTFNESDGATDMTFYDSGIQIRVVVPEEDFLHDLIKEKYVLIKDNLMNLYYSYTYSAK